MAEDDISSKNIPGEIGYTGLDYNRDGSINEEFLRDLQWPQAGETYKEMANNDPTIGAMLFATEMLIRGVKWNITPGGDSLRHEEEAKVLESIMDDMEKPWSETIVDILSFLQYGFSIHEPVYKIRRGPFQRSPKYKSKYSDGLFGLRKLSIRSQSSIDSWEIDEDTDEILGVWQRAANKTKRVFIDRDKYIHFRVNSKRDNPESVSILRNAYRPWFFKKSIEENEAIGIARDLAGIPVMTAPASIMSRDASPDEKAFCSSLEEIVTRIARNEQSGVLHPAVFDPQTGQPLISLKLLSSGGKRQFDTDAIIKRYSSQIAQTVLADFIMLGQSTFGSFALSSNKTKLFGTALGAWLLTIEQTLNNELVPKLAKLNRWDFEALPKFKAGDLESRDLESLSNFFSGLAKEGLVRPDEGLEKFFRNTAQAPEYDGQPISLLESPGTIETTSGSIVDAVTDLGKPTGDAIA